MERISIFQFFSLRRGFFCLLLFTFSAISGFTQNAGISANGLVPPNTSAGLDINFANKGLLIPRVSLTITTAAAPLASHVVGMIVYNTATIADVTPGLYYNNGTKWIPGLPKDGTTAGMQYWDGTTWKVIPVGTVGQKLQINPSGVPTWAP